MGQRIKRADLVSTGVLVLFDDDREALFASEELVALAEQVNAFDRTIEFQKEYETSD